jgi:hypothetical protein
MPYDLSRVMEPELARELRGRSPAHTSGKGIPSPPVAGGGLPCASNNASREEESKMKSYEEFKEMLRDELPLNRKERFYTGTVLPALLFNNGLSNFFRFLRGIPGLPETINEKDTRNDFLFYTEYNLKESAGPKSAGAKIETQTRDTPDVLIEILSPKPRVFIIIEAKMFENLTQDRFTLQMKAQRRAVIEPLKATFGVGEEQIFHLALVPRELGFQTTPDYQVINWEIFLDNKAFASDNHFFNYLCYALENMKRLQADPPFISSTVQFYLSGIQLVEDHKKYATLWIGRKGGVEAIRQDIKSGKWRRFEYSCNPENPSDGKRGQWIPVEDFIQLVKAHDEQG